MMTKVVKEEAELVEQAVVEQRYADVIYAPELAEHESEGVVFVGAEKGELWKTKTYLRPYGVCRAIRFDPEGVPSEDLKFILWLVYDALIPGGNLYTPGSKTLEIVEAIPVSFVSKTDGFSKFTK